jgi:hypothetical protein
MVNLKPAWRGCSTISCGDAAPLHPIGGGLAQHGRSAGAVGDRRLHDGRCSAVLRSTSTFIDGVAQQTLIADRKRREARISQVQRAALGILLIKRQHARRQTGIAVIGQFDRGQRVSRGGRSLVEIDAARRQFAVEDRYEQALAGRDADL